MIAAHRLAGDPVAIAARLSDRQRATIRALDRELRPVTPVGRTIARLCDPADRRPPLLDVRCKAGVFSFALNDLGIAVKEVL